MDGANDVKIFIYLVLPLALPILLLNFVGTFSAQYNDYLWPGLVISSADKKTLMPVIQSTVELLESMQRRGVAVRDVRRLFHPSGHYDLSQFKASPHRGRGGENRSDREDQSIFEFFHRNLR